MITPAPDRTTSTRDVMYLPLSGSLRDMPRVQLLNEYDGELPTPEREVYRVVDMHGIIARDHFTTFHEAATRLFHNSGWGLTDAVDHDENDAAQSAAYTAGYAFGRGDNFNDELAIRLAVQTHALAYNRGETHHRHSAPSFYDHWHKEHDDPT